MRLIKVGYQLVTPINGDAILKRIEKIGRVCYKSEDRITDDSSHKFVKMLIERGHEAVIEHYSFTVKFICDRGVSHEIVRHRIASYAQESTRYCNYSDNRFRGEITYIYPSHYGEDDINDDFLLALETAERCYFALLQDGWTPQQARAVLPNALKTEVIMTANLREWRHFLKLRTASTAHPDMQAITRPLLTELKALIPIVFDGIDSEKVAEK